ncbi:MAG: DNA polymerase III subunit delta' [Pseudolabrys sp.]|nr:DNA polymerase III subunit delta' [Pseudolabrys sp.]MDP2296437.1 DNA polymerase III subunit delta' [Pseudolabrys sp.]
MSDNTTERDVLLPRETAALYGHAEAERALLEAYQSTRMAHAWLIGGPPGIGKATLAYRLARFVLAHPDPKAADVQAANSLAVEADHPVARRIAAQAQGDLLVLERVVNEQTGKLYTVIRVDDVRRSVSFFGSTAGEGGWRIAIVDAVDELQREGANALLKVLEEPPARTLLLLISHAPGRELPTIRSRCRRLLLRPLDEADVTRAVVTATGRETAESEVVQAVAASDGSVGRALRFLDGPALALRQRVLDLFAQLPNPDPRALHALGDALSGSEPQTLSAFIDMVNAWLSARLDAGTHGAAQMAKAAQTWEKVNRAARDVEAYNLERKPLVFSVFGLLAETARR